MFCLCAYILLSKYLGIFTVFKQRHGNIQRLKLDKCYEKYRQDDYIALLFWQWFMTERFLWSATDVRTDMSSWFAMDQMDFAIFNLNFPKIYQLTTGKGQNYITQCSLLQCLVGESCLNQID